MKTDHSAKQYSYFVTKVEAKLESLSSDIIDAKREMDIKVGNKNLLSFSAL